MFNDKESFKSAFLNKLETMHGKSIDETTDMDKYLTLGTMIREYVTRNWIATNNRYKTDGQKQAYYFSMEFLLGRLLVNNLINLNFFAICHQGLKELGVSIKKLEIQEPDAGLGNGGLGRLAACFLDSLSSLSLPGHGCGIRYKYGLFEQKIVEGYQVELPEYWLRDGNVWEIRKADRAVEVRFGGHVRLEEQGGKLVVHHENFESVIAVPYDLPVIGYGNKTVNTLRLWSAEGAFQDNDIVALGYDNQQKFLEYKYSVESISQFLYPDDTNYEGRMLRLKQEYFLVSAGIQSIIRWYKRRNYPLSDFHRKNAFHINDTHPALAVPELMRILMDEEGMGWDEAFEITCRTVSYTNHTTMVEALETWPVDLFQALLPRIYLIVEELNRRFCRQLEELYPGDGERIRKMAIIADGRVKMSHLAIVGSHSVNGVAAIHTKILQKREMKNFYDLYPHKFNNKTNGITHRRWLLKANPRLAELISETIGPSWIRHPARLVGLRPYAGESSFQEKFYKIKQQNKLELASYIKEKCNITVNTDSIFDVHVKRIHAYKRQILNLFHIIDLYNRLKDTPDLDIYPRTFIFGGKAAPGYYLAKRIIKLINTVAAVINADKAINDRIKVVFLDNYRVSLAERIIPAADLSEQISTASKEASGTGNMKFMMNGAVTIGTLDGANIEILEEVGYDNMFIFGLSPSEVLSYYSYGGYNSAAILQSDPRVQRITEQIQSGFYVAGQGEFNTILESLIQYNDEFFVLKDFHSYVYVQERVGETFRDRNKWLEMSILNAAHSGKFSSDRTISQYASQIWGLKPTVIR
ncbi:glycogen/starch/alpha-glucan phosphorylase [Candidatus Micrarchaeota archaeon]|nr:glycogen/starch/alpha-glucan phosphorylase [Candidatus Micrarchaeota archaeon]